MRIVLSGVETNNKGAELMFYAILQELERRHPDADVYLSRSMIKQGLEYMHTSINLHYIPEPMISKLCSKLKVTPVLNKLGIRSAYLNNYCHVKNPDYFIDGSGLLFSDQRINHDGVAKSWYYRLRYLHKKGVKIVFLPQAFGPLTKDCTIRTIKALDKYADLIYAREKVSYDNLIAIVGNKGHIRMSTDFTSLVDGIVPTEYDYLRGRVCVIPNVQMINKGILTKEYYFNILHEIISACTKSGFGVYFLSHEAEKDERLIRDYLSTYDDKIDVVTGLNALQVKGLISTAYLVISSRFHGVASSLNTQVPCLSTSWNHKYAELYKDYGLESGVLPMDNIDEMKKIIAIALNKENRDAISIQLSKAKGGIRKQAKNMWNEIWNVQ